MDEDMRMVRNAAVVLLLVMSFGCSSLVITSTATGNVIFSVADGSAELSEASEPVITVVDEAVVPGAVRGSLFDLNLGRGDAQLIFSTVMLDQVADNLEDAAVLITVALLDVMEHSGYDELIVRFAFSGSTYWTPVSNFLQLAGIELLE